MAALTPAQDRSLPRPFKTWAARRQIKAVALVIAVLLAGPAQPHAQTNDAPVIQTTTGAVQGQSAASVARFLGIPYAAAPVGPLRWRLPQPHAPWQSTRNATKFGAICPQPTEGITLPASSEDCLFLNIYAPTPMHAGHKVMVWIHGGTNTTGAGSFYDPTPMVTTGDVIVVTLNYRLGALGFLALSTLKAESGTTGNYGLADQQLALRWVRDNIAAFGGDPHGVTLFGESSGGMDVFNQLASPASAGLFQRAIVESGGFDLDTQGLAASEAQGRRFAGALGCPEGSPACLRDKSTADVLANQGNPSQANVAYALATVDGMILPSTQRAALAAGRFHRVPVLFGNNAQEGRMFVPPDLSAAEYPKTLASYARAAHRSVPGVLKTYPLADYATPADGAAAAYGDSIFACADRTIARQLSRRVVAYEYEFDDTQGTAPLGPTHGTELRYLFGVSFMGPLDGSPAELPAPSQALALAMQRYWTGFARNGTPDQPGLAAWRPVPSHEMEALVPPEPLAGSVAAFIATHKCSYWN